MTSKRAGVSQNAAFFKPYRATSLPSAWVMLWLA